MSSQAAGPEPFGKYLLDREIARGGMARVYLARLRGLGGFEKRLVVKQILPHLARDPRFVSMFVEEAKTLVQMSHPHIVPVYELGIVDGVYFLAMEYVEGATLADVLDDGPLDPAPVVHLAVQITDALSYAHERFAIVHRDVTPRNVIIDGAGHCRLLDFGIAVPATDDADGELFGTPGYLSPEQARGESLDARSDLFALGAVLFHALEGRPPFDASSLDVIRHLTAVDRPRFDDAEVDRELAAMIERTLEPDPTLRPESARALGRTLRGWLASRHPEGVAPELGARTERARARRDRRRASERPPAPSAGTSRVETTGKVRTLAQSRVLEEIIEGTAAGTLLDSAAPPPRRTVPLVRTERASDPAPSEMPRDEPREPDADEPEATGGTMPLPGRSGRHAAIAASSAGDGEGLGESRGAEVTAEARSDAASPTRPDGAPGSAREPDAAGLAAAAAGADRDARSADPALPDRSLSRVALPLVVGAIALAVIGVGLTSSGSPRQTLAPGDASHGVPADTAARGGPRVEAAPDVVSEPARAEGEPATAERAPGDHAVRHVSAGDLVTAGETAARLPDIAPLPDAPRARSTLDVSARRTWARITVDGRALGNTPVRRTSLAAGPHTIEADNPNLSQSARSSFRLEPGQRAHAIVDLDADPPRITISAR
jgi:tRNA A-37 threonylcarbamoyl transferase component Bud32